MPRGGHNLIDLTGKRFGRWLVLRLSHTDRMAFWLCRCDCGTEKPVAGSELRKGRSLSCGCLKAKTITRRPTYDAWYNMIRRCTDPNNPRWPRYGGRGITVCERWQVFANFLADMGPRPEGRRGKRSLYSIDRIDNERGYEPGNCRWATIDVQKRHAHVRSYEFTKRPDYRQKMRDAANKRWRNLK